MFDGYKDAKDSNLDKQFRDLNWKMDCWIGECTTPLLEVAEFKSMVEQAKTKEHYNELLDHLYRHDATRVDAYKKLEKKIINRMWDDG